MKKFILVLIAFLLLLNGCGDSDRGFRSLCGDNIRFSVQRTTNYDFELCYDNRGSFEFILMNHGSIDITGVIINIEGSNSSLTSNHPIIVQAGGAQLFTMNIQLSSFGEINKMAIYPQIDFMGEPRTCIADRIVYEEIKGCTDLPLY